MGPRPRPTLVSVPNIEGYFFGNSYAPPVSGAELRSAHVGATLGRPVNMAEVGFSFFMRGFFSFFSRFLFLLLSSVFSFPFHFSFYSFLQF
jgi:hypothetical protein